jgi:hypothetical protein
MKNNGFEKRNSWTNYNNSVRENIQKNEFVKVIREKLIEKRLAKKSD